MHTLTPAPAGMTVTFPDDASPSSVVALVLDADPTHTIHEAPRPRVRAVAVRAGRLEVAPATATVAIT